MQCLSRFILWETDIELWSTAFTLIPEFTREVVDSELEHEAALCPGQFHLRVAGPVTKLQVASNAHKALLVSCNRNYTTILSIVNVINRGRRSACLTRLRRDDKTINTRAAKPSFTAKEWKTGFNTSDSLTLAVPNELVAGADYCALFFCIIIILDLHIELHDRRSFTSVSL